MLSRAFSLGIAAGLLAPVLCCSACSYAKHERTSTSAEPVINGEDDRRELYELDSPDERDALTASVAALVWSHRIDFGRLPALNAESLRDAFGVCPDEPFAAEPSAAFCSATLIDDDLVLTAAHCLGQNPDEAARLCGELYVAFDYHYAAANVLALDSGEDVYACRRVALYEKTAGTDDFRDFAILELDRSVSAPRKPASLATTVPELGDPLLAVSHGAGLPSKVDRGGTVTELPPGEAHLVASTDSFAGGSGAPIFNASLELVGHQVRGHADWTTDGECQRAAHADTPNEQHQLVATSIQALCDSGWPSERLCGHAPSCGDGICNAGETSAECDDDCTSPTCGDGLCELDEQMSCAADCAAYAGVPASWLYEPALFPARDGGIKSAPAAGGGGAAPSCRFGGTRAGSVAGTGWWALAALVLLGGARRHSKLIERRRRSRGGRSCTGCRSC